MRNILVSFSGGKTSAFMAVYMKNHPVFKKDNLLFAFANTGKEHEETLIFVEKVRKEFGINIVYLEALVNPIKGKGTYYTKKDFETLSRNGEPLEAVAKKYGNFSKLYRHCTREAKEAPLHKYAKEYFNGEKYINAVGIRADEKHRVKNNPSKIYPLNDINVDKKFINDWWSRQKFNLEIQEHEGNCDFCFLKSKAKRLRLLSEGLDVSWWNRIEIENAKEKQPIFDVRNGLSVQDLINMNNGILEKDLTNDVDFDCYCKST